MSKLFLLLFTISFVSIFAQSTPDQSKIDSIQLVIQNAQHDSTIINAWNNWDKLIKRKPVAFSIQLNQNIDSLCQLNLNHLEKLTKQEKYFFQKSKAHAIYIKGYHLQSLEDYQKSLKIYQALEDKKGEGNVFDMIGAHYFSQGKYGQAIESYHLSRTNKQALNDSIGIVNTMLNEAWALQYMEQYRKALQVLHEGLEISEELGDTKVTSSILYNISLSHYYLSEFDKGIETSKRGLKIMEELGDKAGIMRCLLSIGTNYQSKGAYQMATEYLSQCYQVAKENEDKYYMATSLHTIAIIDAKIGNYDKAIQQYMASVQLYEALEYRSTLSSVYLGIGKIYFEQKEYKKAEEHYQTSLKMSDENKNKADRSAVLNNLGLLSQTQKNTNDALNYFTQSLELAKGLDNKLLTAENMTSIASIYRDKKDYSNALKYFNKSLTITQTIGATQSETINLMELGKCYSEFGKINQAISSSKKALELAMKENIQPIIKDAAYTLFENYKRQNKYEEALKMYEQYNTISDSLTSETNQKEIIRQEYKYAYGKQAIADSIQYAETTKIQEAQLSAQTAINAQQKQRSYFLLFGALLASIFGGWMYHRNRITRKQNQVISLQKQELESLHQVKDHIFAIIGHDLRKPAIAFQGITKKVNYLLKNQDFKTLNALGEEIEKDALALNKLTDNLLNWALMEKDVMPYHPESIPVAPIADEVCALFEKIAKEKNINLSANIPYDLKVYVDKNALQTIIRNLVDNSIKFTGEGGDILLQAMNTPQGVKIEIDDTGIGMTNQQVKNIFLLQKNKSQPSLTGEKGTGLGMHLVNELVKLNQGTINVISQLERGTKFNILLPVKN